MHEMNRDDNAPLGERLSAYLDGELPPEDSRALERALAEDPELAERLEGLRDTSALLARWTVDAPAAPAWLLRPARPRRRWAAWASAAACAACFAVGVGVGLAANPAAPGPTNIYVAAPAATVPLGISSAQADEALREVTASALRTQLAEELRSGGWKEAQSLYKKLTTEYRGTQATEDVLRDPRLGRRFALTSSFGRI